MNISFTRIYHLRSVAKDRTLNFASFEYTEHLLKSTAWIRLVVVYRPPPSTANGLTVAQFFREFSTFLEHLVLLPFDVLILGDFNFHVNNKTDRDAHDFMHLLDTFNLVQHVAGSTHKSGHTLDLLISRQDSSLVKDIDIFPAWISDHSLVQAKIRITKPCLTRKRVTYRKWKEVDVDQFEQDLTVTVANLQSLHSVGDLVSGYNQALQDLVDKHAPSKNSKVTTTHPHADWFTSQLQEEKRKKRKLERNYRRTGTSEDVRLFEEQSNHYSKLLISTRQKFYNEKILTCAGDQKALYSVFNKLLHRTTEPQLPVHDCPSKLADRFAIFFTEKIIRIRAELHACPSSPTAFVKSDNCPISMAKFSSVSEEAVAKIIGKANNKSCSLDPVPTKILKQHLSPLVPVITRVINLSLEEGTMPVPFKEAVLTPILKKSSLDKEVLKNYRPISNLAYISKLIEKVVDHQITDHIQKYNLEEAMQSAYRQHHSTETAWVRLHNDILRALDDNMAVLLVCLDLSAAFDTIDHGILLHLLEHRLGITGKCLEWFTSYLKDRQFRVMVSGVTSEPQDLRCGVPQGSVLGPKLFTLYLLPLGDLARSHGVDFHIYADDCQLYMAFKRDNTLITASKMECLVNDIKSWMTNNMLKLNEDKTEIMVLNGARRPDIELTSLMIGTESVSMSDSTFLLGVELDSTMCLKNHIRNVAKDCFFKLHNMFKIRKCITEEAAKTMVHSMVTSKLDYCNSIFHGLPDCTVKSLVSVQKTAARLVTGIKKYDHITPVLRQLHWLPIRKRIEYKILLLTFKCVHGIAPVYLMDLVHKRRNKNTRADNKNFLQVPKVKKSTFGGRSFSFASPSLWNQLTDDLRFETNIHAFKKHLKTYLFQ